MQAGPRSLRSIVGRSAQTGQDGIIHPRQRLRLNRGVGVDVTAVLARLLPAARDIRNPLAVGFSWLIVLWALLAVHGPEDTAVGQLYDDTVGRLSALWLGAAAAFVAVLFGSGMVRLMDRLMQLLRTDHGQLYNPLDAPEPFWSRRSQRPTGDRGVATRRRVLPPASGEPNYRGHLAEYVSDERERSTSGWRFPDDAPSIRQYELRVFRDLLSDDIEFGALQAEQLLRFSLIPPTIVAAVASLVWAFDAPDASPFLLFLVLCVFGVILFLDYQRTGSLLLARWRR